MAWNSLEASWRSLIADRPLASEGPPFAFTTPDAPWDYGVMSAPLPPVAIGKVLRLRVRAEGGRIGFALAKPNGSALLSDEAAVGPEDGEVELCFVISPDYGSAAVLARNYDAPRAGGQILTAEVGERADVGEARLLGAAPQGAPNDWPDPSASNIARRDEPMWPVSIGNTCEAKVQIARVLQFCRWPDTSQAAFRLQMLPPKRSRDRFGWDLLDWQGVPLPALLAYFDRDFEGLYEREDLLATATGVMHRRFGAEHFHDFEHLADRKAPGFTEAMIDQGYAAGRARFDELAAAFRQHLTRPGPFLYVHVCEDIPNEYLTRQLLQRLASRSPDHRFHLLYVGFEDEDADLSALSAQVSKAYRPRPPAAADMTRWEGDYAAWDKALAPFDLLLPGEAPKTAPPLTEPQAPSARRRRSLFSWLRR